MSALLCATRTKLALKLLPVCGGGGGVFFLLGFTGTTKKSVEREEINDDVIGS